MWLSLLFAACASSPSAPSPTDAPKERTLSLGAYTTPREAYGKVILPAFVEEWKRQTGEALVFEESYQGSGAQARAIKEGFEADIAALSLEPDLQTLEEAKLITRDRASLPNKGIVTQSIVVLAVRKGNPHQIKDWADITRPDIEVLTPNVRTSGGAMWNVAAIWGAARRGHAGAPESDAAGEALLSQVLARVKVMDKGARESINTFEQGIGDVCITYENEVITAQKAGVAIDYVVPSSTILIENPVAVVDAYATRRGNLAAADAFVAYLFTPPAQRAFLDQGYRSIDPSLAAASALPTPADLFTIQDLGGWGAVKQALFDKGAAYDKALATATATGAGAGAGAGAAGQ